MNLSDIQVLMRRGCPHYTLTTYPQVITICKQCAREAVEAIGDHLLNINLQADLLEGAYQNLSSILKKVDTNG